MRRDVLKNMRSWRAERDDVATATLTLLLIVGLVLAAAAGYGFPT